MSSALDLAGALRGASPDDLLRRLTGRVLRASSVDDAFDLAETLLDPSSVRDVLSRLDRIMVLNSGSLTMYGPRDQVIAELAQQQAKAQAQAQAQGQTPPRVAPAATGAIQPSA